MDADERRQTALVLTIGFVIVLTALATWAVIHQVNKKIMEPYSPKIVDIQKIPTTAKEK